MKNLIKLSVLAASAVCAFNLSAEAPHPEASGIDIHADIAGTVLNGGLTIGGDAFVETSLATFHSGNVSDAVNIDLDMVNFGVAVANGGLVIGGDLCSKVSIASIGASTCSNDYDSILSGSSGN